MKEGSRVCKSCTRGPSADTEGIGTLLLLAVCHEVAGPLGKKCLGSYTVAFSSR
jgi:hypothetical protein